MTRRGPELEGYPPPLGAAGSVQASKDAPHPRAQHARAVGGFKLERAGD